MVGERHGAMVVSPGPPIGCSTLRGCCEQSGVNCAFDVIVIGGGHAGVEAAWAADAILSQRPGARVALLTLDPSKVGVMSCNPAIGGLAKGQIVREIDAMNGLMGLAADATGIQFRVLNTSKGAAVRGPRAQCDKHAYAHCVQRMLASRPGITVIGGAVERLLVDDQHVIRAVEISPPPQGTPQDSAAPFASLATLAHTTLTLTAHSVVLTTGTFMRGLMHTGESKTPGGRFGEAPAIGISGSLAALGFELGRLKTGTPPRLKRSTIDWDALEAQWGDERPTPFSDLTNSGGVGELDPRAFPTCTRFPVLPQVECRVTSTSAVIHDAIRANLHRAPMYSGQIESIGPRYCPSLEDKVVRFGERQSHNVYLEPESLSDDWIYCNGISTSLPADVQDVIVRNLPGCASAQIYRYGYAVEYDFVKPHQIDATSETRGVRSLFLAGQINGTSGYEEAAAQGIVAGINAARRALGLESVVVGRDQAYIGVLMDDLVTKTPTEPYRMFTSRAEHRLTLRADNASDRLTPLAQQLGLLEHTPTGRLRAQIAARRQQELATLRGFVESTTIDGVPLQLLLRRPEYTHESLRSVAPSDAPDDVVYTVATEFFYRHYVKRAEAEHARWVDLSRRTIPDAVDFASFINMRTEASQSLTKFRPRTLAQAARLEGVTPADVTLLSVLIRKWRLANPTIGSTDDAEPVPSVQ